ncbi:MAG: hypothetical protein NT149_01030 [Candidatus Gottesmanbacteria bacterium]|nr:hypothetical protein [Candidatus Gottesmanbacteria bacterium]
MESLALTGVQVGAAIGDLEIAVVEAFVLVMVYVADAPTQTLVGPETKEHVGGGAVVGVGAGVLVGVGVGVAQSIVP